MDTRITIFLGIIVYASGLLSYYHIAVHIFKKYLEDWNEFDVEALTFIISVLWPVSVPVSILTSITVKATRKIIEFF